MTREVPLSQGKVALVDDADYERVMRHKWCAVNNRGWWYAKRVICQDGQTFNCYLHRFILGVPDGVRIDHIDGDGLNCRGENMRYASAAQNGRNTRPSKRNTTGYKGVIVTDTGRFRAQIGADGKHWYLGQFAVAEDAAKVYDAAARHFFGEFAWTNFPEMDVEPQSNFLQRIANQGRRDPSSFVTRAKITAEIASEIRRRYAAGGVLQRDLSAEYGVCMATISHIITGRQWKEAA